MLVAATGAASAQPTAYRPPPSYVAGGKADQAAGARILADFHQAGIAGTYWLSFELQVMPRRGDDRLLTGELFGSRNDAGPITRLSLGGQRWLIQGGPQPATWAKTGAAETQPLAIADTLQPLAGTDLTIFDLQMPFLYWTDFAYEGLARIRGRPAHSFVLYPPKDLAASRPGLTGVRISIDTQFQALVQAELLGAQGGVEKTITILDLKKVGEQWIVKSIDLRNNLTHDKTRFTVNAAALNLTLPAELFSAAELGATPPPVPADKIQRL